MCLAMYLFTDQDITEIRYSEINPTFYIEKISKEKEPNAFKWNKDNFNIYYLGSSQGCGCGWNPINPYEEELERKQKVIDRIQLANGLKKLNLMKSWLVVCWEGEQGYALLPTIKISLAEIKYPLFKFEQLRKYAF